MEEQKGEDDRHRQGEQGRPGRVVRHLDDLRPPAVDGRAHGLFVPLLEHHDSLRELAAVLLPVRVVPVRVRARDLRDDGEVVLGRR